VAKSSVRSGRSTFSLYCICGRPPVVMGKGAFADKITAKKSANTGKASTFQTFISRLKTELFTSAYRT